MQKEFDPTHVKDGLAIAADMQARGIDEEPGLEFELVFLEDLAPTPELLAKLTAEKCISRNLCRRGLAIVDKRTKSPIVIHDSGLTSSQ